MCVYMFCFVLVLVLFSFVWGVTRFIVLVLD